MNKQLTAEKKIAIFVEGFTEQAFVEKLILEIAGRENVGIEVRKAGSKASRPRWSLIHISGSRVTPRFVLLVNCAADNRVKSEMRDNYESLAREGYHAIIGLRDVYPDVQLDEIPKLRRGLEYGMRTKPIQASFILAIMEIEAWFMAEYNHLARIAPCLTPEFVLKAFGFDPSCDDMRLRAHPAEDLSRIYATGGAKYEKLKHLIQRTVDVLDYEYVYCGVAERFDDLRKLVIIIDELMT